MLSLRRALASAIVLATGIATLAALPGCTTTEVRGRPLDFERIGLKPQWETHIPLATGENIVDFWRVNDSVYVSTSFAHLVRVDALAGTIAWEKDLENRTYKILRPAEIPGTTGVLVLNLGTAFILDKQNGATINQRSMDFAPSTDPFVSGENTFFVGGLNYYYAIYLDTLKGRKWVTAAKNDAFIARPAEQEGSLILASESGKLRRVSKSSGDWIWTDHKTDGRVTGGLAADARAVYVPCLDSKVYAFDMGQGYQLWSTPVPGTLDKPLVVTRSDVLVPTGAALYSLSAANGTIRWHVDGVNAIGTVIGDRVWVTTHSGELESLSLDTGEVLDTTTSGGGTIIKNLQDKLIIVINKSGNLGAYNAK